MAAGSVRVAPPRALDHQWLPGESEQIAQDQEPVGQWPDHAVEIDVEAIVVAGRGRRYEEEARIRARQVLRHAVELGRQREVAGGGGVTTQLATPSASVASLQTWPATENSMVAPAIGSLGSSDTSARVATRVTSVPAIVVLGPVSVRKLLWGPLPHSMRARLENRLSPLTTAKRSPGRRRSTRRCM